jgi:hypothetical protein
MSKAMIDQAKREAEDEKNRGIIEGVYNKLSSVKPSKDPRDGVRGQKGYKKGGSVTRADGCITKAHTKGTMVKMAGGGMC